MIAAFHPGHHSTASRTHCLAFRPVSLHKLKLTPDGPEMIADGEVCGPLCLSWRKHLMFDMCVDELVVDDSDPARLTLRLRSHDRALRSDQAGARSYEPGALREESWLALTYDPGLGSYVYEVRTRLSVTPGREEAMIAHDKRGMEFGDILPAGANDRFPPAGNKAFTHIIYQGSDGKVYNRPQNRHFGPDKMDILYAPDGWAAFVAEDAGNPIVEFVDGTGSLVRSEICWAMYDLHFKTRTDESRRRLRAGKPLEVRYRLYSLPPPKARALLADSLPDPVLDHPMVKCPVFTGIGVNDFAPSEAFRRPSSQWFWHCSDNDCYWDWQTGEHAPGCLVIDRNSPEQSHPFGDAPWNRMFEFASDGIRQSYWVAPRTPVNRALRIEARARTRNVRGNLSLAVEYQGQGTGLGKPSHMIVCADECLSGTRDWTTLGLDAQPPPGTWTRAGLFLALRGTGICWIDNVTVSTAVG